MNKQQLASKIWESANKMRSKVEANEYKDYILGFIFYKYLSDKQLKFCRESKFSEEDIKALAADDTDAVTFIQKSIGYFVAYDHLFSTWVDKGKDFGVGDVRDALSAFTRFINATHRKVFDRILNTLDTGLSKLGESASAQTKAISDLIQLIKAIPMDGKQDYDVLGFIYEYLISMFAANAGKKAGEFYTPHEVSLLMSEIIANHLKERTEIKIYDPTSGSGSLLINIGRSVAKYISDEDNIKYFVQEIKENTYNLTRMNLVMRGIIPDNIVARNGDTLEEDWPYFEDNDPVGSYNPLYVDAVVSNPPYSQAWEPLNKEVDPRFARFGLAPKTKADFAFLLHDLFHLKPDGIMTIVLPHGVLFRGGEEGVIRKNLIEQNHIDAIIGLPANIFFGTGIPTIIMVLKKNRPTSDVLIIDASKGFAKVGKNNVLRACDIKRITDAVINRPAKVNKFARLVGLDEIRNNEYNLNIPRYVDSSEAAETWDVYASMFGGIPQSELAQLNDYWQAFPSLFSALFAVSDTPYCELATPNVSKLITDDHSVKQWMSGYEIAFADFEAFLQGELTQKMMELNTSKEESIISEEIFKRLADIALVDKYSVFQTLDDEWMKTVVDLEILQTEGFQAVKKVDPNLILKKKNGKEQEVQDGYVGHIIPFELVQATLLSEETTALNKKQQRLADLDSLLEEILDSLTDDDKESGVLNESKDAFVPAEVSSKIKELFGSTMKAKTATLQFSKDSFEYKLVQVQELMIEQKDLRAQVKKETQSLHLLTKDTIENMTDGQAIMLLEQKWIKPLVTSLEQVPSAIISDLVVRVQTLADKYATTYAQVATEITQVKSSLSNLINDLTGNEFDLKGLSELQTLLTCSPQGKKSEKND